MAKIARYNGGNTSKFKCTEPTELVVGKEYKVLAEYGITPTPKGTFYSQYLLEGVEGYFDSAWFEDILPADAIYIVFSRELPIVGERYCCFKPRSINKHYMLSNWHTSVVKKVEHMGNNIYRVTTCNSVYIVQVGLFF